MRRLFATTLAVALAVALTGAVALRAQDAAEAEAEEEEATPLPDKPLGKSKHMGKDKGDIEKYLKHRLAAIKTSHKQRLTFMGKDGKEWESFWNKVKDDRNLFEVRIARQRLDLFESLGSLESSEHPTTIADFERLQTNQIRAFEGTQREKMQDFFQARERRWKEYYVAQEKDRANFAAEVEDSWDQLKAALKLRGSGKKSSPRPSRSNSSSSDGVTPPRRF